MQAPLSPLSPGSELSINSNSNSNSEYSYLSSSPSASIDNRTNQSDAHLLLRRSSTAISTTPSILTALAAKAKIDVRIAPANIDPKRDQEIVAAHLVHNDYCTTSLYCSQHNQSAARAHLDAISRLVE
jgi:hypothetical protein